MTQALDFSLLEQILGDWPSDVPERGTDGIFGRLCQVLRQSSTGGSSFATGDLISLLRQVLRRQTLQSGIQARLRVPASIDWPSRDIWATFGIHAQSVGPGQFLIEANPWSPDWLAAPETPLFEDAFAEREVRLDWRCPIDPFLGDATPFLHYVSPGQREAVRSA